MSERNVEDLLNEEDDVEDYNLDNEQEEKLLRDDNTEGYDNEASDNELDENDVLSLEDEDELGEEDAEGRRISKGSERFKTDKFTNERPVISPVKFTEEEERNKTKPFKKQFQNTNNLQQNKGRGGRFNRQQKWQRGGNRTVHINPRFNGQVPINGSARLKWDSTNDYHHQQLQINSHGRGGYSSNNFRQPTPRMQQWEHQPDLQERRICPPQYVSPRPFNNEMAIPQNYNSSQMPLIVNPQISYNQPNQIYSSREVFPQQPASLPPPVYQPPPQYYHQPPSLPPTPYCNNPVYNHPAPYPAPSSCYPVSTPYNCPPPVQPEYYQQYPPPQHQPPPSNYCQPPPAGCYNEDVERRGEAGFVQRRMVKAVFAGKPPQKKRFTNKNFETVGLKKKRVVDVSNLHEIKTVESVENKVDVKKVNEEPKQLSFVIDKDLSEDLDEEYMRKIEEQKRLREQIFKQKELKRIQKAAKADLPAENTPIAPLVKPAPKHNFVKHQNVINSQKNRVQIRNLVQINQQPSGEPPSIEIEVARENAPRVIRVKDDDEKGLTKSFLNNRMVLANDQKLPVTPVVVVKNLSAGTTEQKLQKMCQGIGEIQTLHLSREERQATIHFKSVASAHAFYKKYQRYMLDLSMIQVHLKTV